MLFQGQTAQARALQAGNLGTRAATRAVSRSDGSGVRPAGGLSRHAAGGPCGAVRLEGRPPMLRAHVWRLSKLFSEGVVLVGRRAQFRSVAKSLPHSVTLVNAYF